MAAVLAAKEAASAKPIRKQDDEDRLMDFILDISNELDIDILCHRILVNVGRLTGADRCSLFLARGPREKRYLEAKLFDVEEGTSEWNEVPLDFWGSIKG